MESAARMMKNRGLALKLALLILTSITVIFSFVFIYNYMLCVLKGGFIQVKSYG